MAQPSPKSIKFFEVLNWLLGPSNEIPENFIENSSGLNSIVPYIVEQLWVHPRLVAYLNSTNDLYNIPDSIEMLVLLKKLFINFNITKRNLWQFIPTRERDIVQAIQDYDGLDEGNARAKVFLLKKLDKLGSIDKYFKPSPVKANLQLNKEDKLLIKETLERTKEKELKLISNNVYLPNLSQASIDEFGLVLFDIQLLKKTNQVLFIFIDGEYNKKYYLEPFRAEIYISTKDGVINNDYIENKTDDFLEYVINDNSIYSKLKFLLASNYKKVINGFY